MGASAISGGKAFEFKQRTFDDNLVYIKKKKEKRCKLKKKKS